MKMKNPERTDAVKPVMKTRSSIYGWISPQYNQSAAGTLDPDLLRRNRCIGLFPDSPDGNSYKVLKTVLHERLKKQGLRTVLVTSASRGEGKTLTAINLSFALAQDFSHTVLLVDCDLRQQAIHKYLGIPTSKGLADYLSADIPARDMIVWPGIDKFTFISGGSLTHDGADLLSSPRMHSFVHEMRARYSDRCILFDSPPFSKVRRP
ncbi:hypothetical protein EG829_16940 [bacterium]|nr:hypothetical protein [bacterium]